MARIPEAELEQLKSRIDLTALIRAKGIELKKHGQDLIGHCPFHDDRTPSLVVTPSKNLWHCLGACQTGGSVVDWVMKCEKVSFRHAVEILRSGDPEILSSKKVSRLKGRATIRKLDSPVDLAESDEQKLLQQVLEYYHSTLQSSPEALSYLEARGIRDEAAIAQFKLGFANRTLGLRIPEGNREAGHAVRKRLTEIGILRESGHEHFRDALIIPVIGSEGLITEVYGRRTGAHQSEGVSPHLYLPGPHQGIWNPEGLRDESQEVILCEALIDALTFWVHGFKNVTASYGIQGFTKDHLAAFQKNGIKKVVIAYDNDPAGNAAAEKLEGKLRKEGIQTSRALFPKGMDANEYALRVKPGKLALQAAIGGSELQVKAKWVKPWGAKETMEEPISLAESASVSEAESSPLASLPPLPVAAPLPASPLKLVENETPTEIRGEDVWIRLGEREYRIRGLGKNLSFDLMRVNVRITHQAFFHIDTIDLYNAKARTAFMNAAAAEVGLESELIKKDLGKVLLKLEALQEEQIRRTLEAEPKKNEAPEMTDAERAEALALLKSPDILERILSDLSRCGVVGEETNKLVGYLAAVSRKLEDPLAIIIQSSSAAGKSSLMEAILALMPAEEKVKYSAMTGQSLFYMGEKDLKHKILAIAEEEGAHRAAYALKLLQSDGEISIASTGKDAHSGKLVTHEYRVEGPVAIFLTTTAIEIDEELLNRCIVLTVNEDREQTRAIHEMQRERQTLEGLLARREKSHLLKLHQNAQRLLNPFLVANPYAKKLTFLDTSTRTRRDHMKYLTLIRTITLLHQQQREVKTAIVRGEIIEYIEATLSDIEIANRLCHQVLGRSLDELSPQTRRLLLLLDLMVKDACQRQETHRRDYRFTRKEVRAWTAWSDSQLQVHLTKLTELEYVITHRGGRGQNLIYELLWSGDQKNANAPQLMGLIETGKIATEGELSLHSFELTRRFLGASGPIFGASSPQLPAVLGPNLSEKSLEIRSDGQSPAIGHKNESKSHPGGLSETDASCTDPAKDARSSSRGELK